MRLRPSVLGLLISTMCAVAVAAPPSLGARHYKLVGTVVSMGGSMAIVEDTGGSQFALFPGDKLAGCRLKEVMKDRILLRCGDHTRAILLNHSLRQGAA